MKLYRLKLIVITFFIVFICSSCRKSDIILDDSNTITDDGSGTGTVTWTNDKEYLIEGFVFVNPGQTLTIEKGTIIRAKTGQGEDASALIVARGGKIIAKGTADEPIIFTVEADDLDGSVPLESRGLWGGLIILGNAPLNNEYNEAIIEGIPFSETRGIYGGTDENDNSGTLQYISIRHGGTNIGEGNEINGLTLGGVGKGTTIENIEVISNEDDGFEFFGGTVNCKYLAAAFCGDDGFDFDLGYQGKLQFIVAIQASSLGDNLAEHDGGIDPIYGQPYSIPKIYNATYIGNNYLASSKLITFQDNGAGKYFNSIFYNQKNAVGIEYVSGFNDSYSPYENSNLVFENNLFYHIEGNQNSDMLTAFNHAGDELSAQQTALENYFILSENSIIDPGIEITETDFDIIPSGDVTTNLASYSDSWFTEVSYKGAINPVGTNWLFGWSLLSQSGKVR